MAKRFSVQTDDEAECIEGLHDLCTRMNLEPIMPPMQITDDRWLARAVPRPAETPDTGPDAG